LVVSVYFVVGVSFIGSAAAQSLGPSPYLEFPDSPFASTSFNYFHLEDFEDGLLNTPGVSANIGTVFGPAGGADSVDGDDGIIDGLGQDGISYYSGFSGTQIVFDFDQSILGSYPTHAGVVWTDVASGSNTEPVSFEAFDATGTSLGTIGPFILGDGSRSGGTAEDRFFGWVNLGGISSIALSMASSNDWELDHVQYGAIPEPSSIVLLAVAAFGLTSYLRRRNRPQ
jgi:hypothetical protein